MSVTQGHAAPPRLVDPRRHPLSQIVERIRADAKLDQMESHERFIAEEASDEIHAA